MKTLLVLRHAKSSWDDPSLPDHDRPLNKRGKRDAPRMGALLEEQRLVPDLVLCSTAARALATAREVIQACGYDGEVRLSRELYLATAETYAAFLRREPRQHERVLLVGHNPGLEELVHGLTGEEHHLSTAALARLELPIKSWDAFMLDRSARLVDLWRPKELAG
jgi:phosphohistidine phosphatase